MKYVTLIAFQIFAITLMAFSAPPPEDEPPIKTKEQLVERLSAIPMDELRHASASEQRAIWEKAREEMRTLVDDHPEIIPLLPNLRDHRNPWVRRMVFENELRVPDLHDEAVRRAMRSGDSTLEGLAMSHVGPFLGEPDIAKIWLARVREGILKYGGLTNRLSVLKNAPDDVEAMLESEVARILLNDLREGRITAKVISSVITFLRERREIDRDALLEAVITAEAEIDRQIKEDRERFETPNLALQRAKDSLLLNRVELGDEEALVTILTYATTPGEEERYRFLLLLGGLEPTPRILSKVLELLGDTEQVSEGVRPSNAPVDFRGSPIFARDMAAYMLRRWFADAPRTSPHHTVVHVSEEQIAELRMWLAVKIIDMQTKAIQGDPNETKDDQDK